MKKTYTYLKKTVFSLIFIALVLVVWQVVALIVNDEYIVPSLYNVAVDMLKIFYVEQFYQAYFSTLLRASLGFAISFIIGSILAVLGAKYDFVKSLCSPLVSAVRLIPTMAIVSLLCLALSPSFTSAVERVEKRCYRCKMCVLRWLCLTCTRPFLPRSQW